MPQTSASVAHEDTVRYTDHNKVVTDVADLYATKLSGIPDTSVTTAKLAANAATKVTTATDTSNRSTSSASYVDSGMSITFTVDASGSQLLLFCQIPYITVSSTENVKIGIKIDAGADINIREWNLVAGVKDFLFFTYPISGLSAGSHTIKVRMLVATARTYELRNDLMPATMTIIDFKR